MRKRGAVNEEREYEEASRYGGEWNARPD